MVVSKAALGATSSSSCAPDAPSAAKSKVLVTVPLFTPLPHEGYVSVGTTRNGNTALVHRLTLQKVELPAGDWLIEYDGGRGAACNQDSPELDVLLFDDVFTQQVCATGDDPLVVIQNTPHPGEKRIWSLSQALQRYSDLTLKFPAGPTKAMHEFTVYRLELPRQACRIFLRAPTSTDTLR